MSHRSQLLNNEQLVRSGVVANCRMNRERRLTGANGYQREVGFHPLEFLQRTLRQSDRARWLDLCCGSGAALIEAVEALHIDGTDANIEIVGVDLVGMFARAPSTMNSLRLIEASLIVWHPDREYDLITCVHGLHYIGDKLELISRAASWLTKTGYFVANLGLENFKLDGGRPSSRIIAAELRRQGLNYDTRRKRVSCLGRKRIRFPFRYLGADDQSGPNYTRQSVVDSHYERLCD